MDNIIYVPLSNKDPLRKRRLELVQQFVNEGWRMTGLLEVTDPFGTTIEVEVLVKPISI